MPIIIGLLVVIILTEITLKPRIDRTPEGKTFLWYGQESKRKFIEL